MSLFFTHLPFYHALNLKEEEYPSHFFRNPTIDHTSITKKNITAQFKMRNISHLFFYKSHIHITPRARSRRQGLDSSRHYLFIPLTKYFHFFYSIYRVFFSHWYPPKKLKYGKPRLGVSTLT